MDLGAVHRQGVVPPVRLDPTGRSGPTRRQLRKGGWRRTGQGLYVPADVDAGGLHQRIVEAAAFLPAGGAVTGWAALAWLRTKWFNGTARDGRTPLPVPLALDGNRDTVRSQGVLLSDDWLFEDDIVEVDGLPITIPERAVSFEARRARSDEDAVRVIDLAAAADHVSVNSMRDYAARLVARPGIRRVRRAIELADENVWSPMETTMRLAWSANDLCGPLLCNAPVFDLAGNHLFTPDLLDPGRGVAGEYDGLVHLEDGVRKRDLDRESLYRDHGLELVMMVNSDLPEKERFDHRLAGAYRRARRPLGSWTLDQPPWWVDTSTVAKRLALTEEERDRWLRWQVA